MRVALQNHESPELEKTENQNSDLSKQICQSCFLAKKSLRISFSDSLSRDVFWKALVKAEVPQISAAEKLPESRLLRDSRVTKALLQFLADITVRCFGNENMRTVIRAQL